MTQPEPPSFTLATSPAATFEQLVAFVNQVQDVYEGDIAAANSAVTSNSTTITVAFTGSWPITGH